MGQTTICGLAGSCELVFKVFRYFRNFRPIQRTFSRPRWGPFNPYPWFLAFQTVFEPWKCFQFLWCFLQVSHKTNYRSNWNPFYAYKITRINTFFKVRISAKSVNMNSLKGNVLSANRLFKNFNHPTGNNTHSHTNIQGKHIFHFKSPSLK